MRGTIDNPCGTFAEAFILLPKRTRWQHFRAWASMHKWLLEGKFTRWFLNSIKMRSDKNGS